VRGLPAFRRCHPDVSSVAETCPVGDFRVVVRLGVHRSGRTPGRHSYTVVLGAAGLPLTEELLERIWPRPGGSAEWHRQRTPRRWDAELERAVRVLYPQGAAKGFRPSVADFFIVL
jgi:hypothetical protein